MSSPSTISDAQLAANRENAHLSTGPKSPEGKFRVRLNGLQHGLTGDTILMPYEDAAQYETFIANIVATLKPEGTAEQNLARAMADGYWRLNRARSIENNIFAFGAATAPVHLDADPRVNAGLTEAQTWLENARQFQLLTLYEGRIDRTIRKNAAELKELQTARIAAHEKALEEAALLAQLAESKGQQYDLALDGFGFSKELFDRCRDRQTRLAAARTQFSVPSTRPNRPLKRAA